jgi:transposase
MDEARFGTKTRTGYVWFKKGHRPRIKIKLGFKNFYIFGAVNPQNGECFQAKFEKCNTDNMNQFLEQFSKKFPEKIALIMDGAGWHKSKTLIIPENISIIHLPPYSPELNPTEKLWQYSKENTIKNKVFDTLEELEHIVTNFIDSIAPERIKSVCRCGYLFN